MTYCVGMVLDKGLVLMSDTRTNSGVDNISVFRKMFHWSVPGDRVITLMTAGNLATTQAVISRLEERTKAPSERQNSLMELSTMFQVASETGKLLREVIAETQTDNGARGKGRFTAHLSVGLPLDLMVIERDSFAPTHERRIESTDPYFTAISDSWSEALRSAFHSLPDYSFYQPDETT